VKPAEPTARPALHGSRGGRYAGKWALVVLSSVATWYDTRGDKTNALVNIWGGSNVGPTITGPLSTFKVSIPGSSPAGQTVPWNHNEGGVWWDYQAVAPNADTFTFLAAWGGDARLGQFKSGVWSAVIK
jgi:hypothetical protein